MPDDDITRVVAIDFDGVLGTYTGWRGWRHLGTPVEGAREAVQRLRSEGWRVILFSTRGCNELESWCEEHGFEVDGINCNPYLQGQNPGKPIATVYVDDRAIQFNGDWRDTVDRIMSFTTYWERKHAPWFDTLASTVTEAIRAEVARQAKFGYEPGLADLKVAVDEVFRTFVERKLDDVTRRG